MLAQTAPLSLAGRRQLLGTGLGNSTPAQRALHSNRRHLPVRAGPQSGGGGGRQPWDFGRFLKTVLYFNPPPAPQDVISSIFKGLSGQGQSSNNKTSATSSAAAAQRRDASPPSTIETLTLNMTGSGNGCSGNDVVLVTGATGGVGKRVVARLLARGRHVRALARDLPKARELLSVLPAGSGGRLELVTADVTQPKTLLPEFFEGVQSVVCCTAVKVAPKEGDTQDRQKYYQGIKFFDPEIVGDTPEAVELGGMRNLLAAVAGNLTSAPGKVVFAPDGSGPVQGWGSLDDVVMGGISESGFAIRQGAGEDGGPCGVFGGNVTSANNGGFASVRTRNLEPPLDLSGADGLELRVKGNGLRYKLILRCDNGWDTVGYTGYFDTQPGGWQTARIPFKDFKPVFRAKTVTNMAPLNTANICSLQLMLSKFEQDGALNPTFREGAFELPLQRVSAYTAQPQTAAPRFVLVSSAGVTRPNRPGIDVEKEPPAVKMNDMLGGILTYKLAAEDALRASGVPFAVVRPVALTEEPEGMPLIFDQGDTIKGKVSREDVAQLCVQLLSQPAALNTTFEIGSSVPFSQPWTVDPSAPPAPRDWAAVLPGAGLQQGVTGKTVDGRYLGKEPEPAAAGSTSKAAAVAASQ